MYTYKKHMLAHAGEIHRRVAVALPAIVTALCIIGYIIWLYSTVGEASEAPQPPPQSIPKPSEEINAASLLKTAADITESPQKVKTGFYFISAGKFDFQTASVPLVFYMWMIYRGSEEPTFEFMNCRNAYLEKQEEHRPYPGTDVNYVVFKVSGIFEQTTDYRNYPCDSFSFRVLIEDTAQELDQREYIPHLADSGLDTSFRLTGWNIEAFRLKSAVHTYSTSFGMNTGERSKYSQLAAEIDVSRLNPIIFMKTVTPAMIFLLTAMLGALLPLEQFSQKISLPVAALFSSVAYHINLSQGLPPLTYLTLADRMMITNYLIIFLCLVTAVGMSLANKNSWQKTELFFVVTSRWLIPIAVGCALYMLLTNGKII